MVERLIVHRNNVRNRCLNSEAFICLPKLPAQVIRPDDRVSHFNVALGNINEGDPVKESSTPSVVRPALRSSLRFLQLLSRGSIYLKKNRLGNVVTVHQSGNSNYTVFRETVSRDGNADICSVLIVGFRLRSIGSNPLLHWIFQRICIISTPIWSGFAGFRTKLWMVDARTKNYLGIYEWAGEKNARAYTEWLCTILIRLSTPGSVWYEIRPNEQLEQYVMAHEPPARLSVMSS